MAKKSKEVTLTPTLFALLLADVKSRIQTAQTRAMLAVNSELVRLYWDIGQMIDQRQQHEGWGSAVIPRLAAELKNEIPEVKGFSERNIKRMLSFYRAYPVPAQIVPQAVAQIDASEDIAGKASKNKSLKKVPQAVAQRAEQSLLWQVPWGHHVWLMEKVKDSDARYWYMEQTLLHGWSRNILDLQIDAQAHLRQGRAVSNFDAVLPKPDSDLAQQVLKDPYIFDFLTLTEPFHERELETELVRQVEKFLLELGQGFAFVGRQYRLDVGDEDFYLDLLFYHLRLRAFVVIDLKKGKFKPEYAGKLNFYCNVVNDQLRHPGDGQTIGLILCQSHNRLQAEYSFAGIDKPIGISTYELTRSLPKKLQSALPTVEQIEEELQGLAKPQAKKIAKKREVGSKTKRGSK